MVTVMNTDGLIELTAPGDILREEFLEPMGVTPYRLAKSIGVSQSYITKIFKGGGISPEVSLLLDRYFGLTLGFWARLQADYDVRVARRKVADRLDRVIPYRAAA
jgi:addiction module HigA family antidote